MKFAQFSPTLLAIIFALALAPSCGKNTRGIPSADLDRASSTTVAQPKNNFALSSEQAPSINQNTDVPLNTPSLDSLDISSPPDPAMFSQLPYYCDPANYPHNIIYNNRACDRFQPIPYVGYGSGSRRHIGYRLRDDLGEPRYDDDDDHHHRNRNVTTKDHRQGDVNGHHRRR